jgi:hypothetical protein
LLCDALGLELLQLVFHLLALAGKFRVINVVGGLNPLAHFHFPLTLQLANGPTAGWVNPGDATRNQCPHSQRTSTRNATSSACRSARISSST